MAPVNKTTPINSGNENGIDNNIFHLSNLEIKPEIKKVTKEFNTRLLDNIEGDFDVDEYTGNETNEQVWLMNGGEINNGYKIGNKTYQGLDKVFVFGDGLLALVHDTKLTTHGKHLTEIRNYGKKEYEKVNEVTESNDIFRSVIDLRTGTPIKTLSELDNYINLYSKDSQEAENTKKEISQIFSH